MESPEFGGFCFYENCWLTIWNWGYYPGHWYCLWAHWWRWLKYHLTGDQGIPNFTKIRSWYLLYLFIVADVLTKQPRVMVPSSPFVQNLYLGGPRISPWASLNTQLSKLVQAGSDAKCWTRHTDSWKETRASFYLINMRTKLAGNTFRKCLLFCNKKQDF